jgi:hypothetical protein
MQQTGGNEKCIKNFGWKNVGADNLVELEVDGRTIL